MKAFNDEGSFSSEEALMAKKQRLHSPIQFIHPINQLTYSTNKLIQIIKQHNQLN
jgi:hypothetical protein